MAYREFHIQKKSGKTRRICAPDADMLRRQRALLPFLEAVFHEREAELFPLPVFHGFVKGRNCVTAARLHLGFAHTETLDISNFFDSVFLSSIPDITVDPAVVTHADGSLAQGFATSPILANIYLLQPISELHSYLTAMFPSFALTVYADDIQISIPPSDYSSMNMIIAVATAIFKKYALDINRKKTRIRHAKFGNRRILGIQVGATTLYPNRKLRRKIRAARHQANGPSLGGLTTAARLLPPRCCR